MSHRRPFVSSTAVSYIPEKVVARPGENVTVYCVFNDHNVDASMAEWKLNFKQLHRSQYRAVNQRVSATSAPRFLSCGVVRSNNPLDVDVVHFEKNQVSQITLRPSGTRMYDLLQCTQGWTIPYSQIYVEGELSVHPVKYYTLFRTDAHPQT